MNKWYFTFLLIVDEYSYHRFGHITRNFHDKTESDLKEMNCTYKTKMFSSSNNVTIAVDDQNKNRKTASITNKIRMFCMEYLFYNWSSDMKKIDSKERKKKRNMIETYEVNIENLKVQLDEKFQKLTTINLVDQFCNLLESLDPRNENLIKEEMFDKSHFFERKSDKTLMFDIVKDNMDLFKLKFIYYADSSITPLSSTSSNSLGGVDNTTHNYCYLNRAESVKYLKSEKLKNIGKLEDNNYSTIMSFTYLIENYSSLKECVAAVGFQIPQKFNSNKRKVIKKVDIVVMILMMLIEWTLILKTRW